MNSLEDAYINIAKAEEKLHAELTGKTFDDSPFGKDQGLDQEGN